MASSDSLPQKMARNPFRFGMIIGFLGVPFLWMMGEDLVRVALQQPVLPAEAFWRYEASGALIGAFLGGQAARIWAKWRAGQLAPARSIAFFTGGSGVVFYLTCALFDAARSQWFSSGFHLSSVAFVLSGFVIMRHLPFLLCLLLLLGALFAPRR